VSSGGIITKTNLVFKEGYQAHLAKIIKKKTKIITRAGGMISNYAYAKKIVENNSVDLINVARRFINDPTWLIKLQKKPHISDQYKKCF
jgi:2,4-dienoyl-CoA reductase-like NADH-dependent reductase (Old Yellow Enzyme family)